MSVTCLFSVENESRNKNQIFGVNIEISGISGYKSDFSVQSPCVKTLHPFHSFFLSFGFFPLFLLTVVCLSTGEAVWASQWIVLLLSSWKFKKTHKTEQIKPPRPFVFGCVKFHGNSWIGVMGRVGICHGARSSVPPAELWSLCVRCAARHFFFTLNKSLKVAW